MNSTTTELGRLRSAISAFDFERIFVEELGWDLITTPAIDLAIDGQDYELDAIAEKSGMVVFRCQADDELGIPRAPTRRRIDREVEKVHHEHLVIFVDRRHTRQVWQWVRREPGQPSVARHHEFVAGQSGEALAQRLTRIAVDMADEGRLTIVDIARRAKQGFDVDKVTKTFYQHFKTERHEFVQGIEGIDEPADKAWYASVMINRLMFTYFIQQKGFLDGDTDYLEHRLTAVQSRKGVDQFFGFYKHFLVRLFHEGFATRPKDRTSAFDELVGRVPYLNGGIFDVHPLERAHPTIDIPDATFERLFAFFRAYRWHLDERPIGSDDEVNPDVLGYIFEKYVNQREMGAYYTKEDITDYISRSVIVPQVVSKAMVDCPIAFESSAAAWLALKRTPERYIFAEVLHGLDRPAGASQVVATSVPPPDAVALPTETWTEVRERHDRASVLLESLASGEVTTPDRLVHLNLDLRLFLQDLIEECEGPETLRALFRAISGLRVLDPTCGSGAFLFAALGILQPLYEACLERMAGFIDDARHASPGGTAFQDFRRVLSDCDAHPNRAYFVLKQIILNNLYGVDIVEEAVEICRLRLFLKLMAQVSDVSDLEPLPDIDFNIEPGNSFVGGAAAKSLPALLTGRDQIRMDSEDSESRIRTQLGRISAATTKFRESQEAVGGANGQRERKARLIGELDPVRRELTMALGRDYGLDMEDEAIYEKFRRSHQPFHWFIEFYEIMEAGGFDVVIGNPPYVETSKVEAYTVRGFETAACGDLFAFTLERSMELCKPGGRFAFIVPMSAFSVTRMRPLQELLHDNSSAIYVSSWSGDAHPAKLFEGVNKRLQIIVAERKVTPSDATRLETSRYIKWYSSERPHLFRTAPVYFDLPTDRAQFFDGSVAKIDSKIAMGILDKIRSAESSIGGMTRRGSHKLYYTRKVSFFLQFLKFIPEKRDAGGALVVPSELKELRFRDEKTRDLALGALSSSLFYWFFIANSDCRNLNKREVEAFRLPASLSGVDEQELGRLVSLLMEEYQQNSSLRTVEYKGKGAITVQYFNFRPSKPTLDKIDTLLAPYYGLTEQELGYVINYDLKYRMGRHAESGEDEGA